MSTSKESVWYMSYLAQLWYLVVAVHVSCMLVDFLLLIFLHFFPLHIWEFCIYSFINFICILVCLCKFICIPCIQEFTMARRGHLILGELQMVGSHYVGARNWVSARGSPLGGAVHVLNQSHLSSPRNCTGNPYALRISYLPDKLIFILMECHYLKWHFFP